MSDFQYSTGVCNIGEAEIAQRRKIGYLGLGLTIVFFMVYLGLIFSIELNPLFGVLVFIPAEVFTVGFLQARKKFCAAYGLTHRQNVASPLGVTLKIEDEASHKKDRNKALLIIIQSIIYAGIITILVSLFGLILYQFS